MRFRSYQCWLPRDADTPRDYEDASAHSTKSGRAVIADGVSTAIFSRDWARLLTRTAVVDPPDTTSSEAMAAWLQPLQQMWRQTIGYDTVARDWIRGPKLKSIGAQATLLLLEIEPLREADGSATSDGDYRLTVHSIGDCCLFVIRDGHKMLSFPMTDSAAYAAGPQVLSSIAKNVSYSERFEHLEDRCRPGDLLVACTDAIGLWAMQEYEDGKTVDWMRYWDNDAAWQEDIVIRRARGPKDPGNRMRVDDCTLLLLQVVAEEEVEDEPETQPDRSDEPLLIAGAPVSAPEALPEQETRPEVVAAAAPEPDVAKSSDSEPQGEVVVAVAEPPAVVEHAASSQTVEPGCDAEDSFAPISGEVPANSAIKVIDTPNAAPEIPVTADDDASSAGPHAQEPPGFLKRIFGFGSQT